MSPCASVTIITLASIISISFINLSYDSAPLSGTTSQPLLFRWPVVIAWERETQIFFLFVYSWRNYLLIVVFPLVMLHAWRLNKWNGIILFWQIEDVIIAIWDFLAWRRVAFPSRWRSVCSVPWCCSSCTGSAAGRRAAAERVSPSSSASGWVASAKALRGNSSLLRTK